MAALFSKNSSRFDEMDRLSSENQEMLFCALNRSLDFGTKLGAGQINRIYKRIAKKAGLDDAEIKRISGHSMRVGTAQDLLNSGASMPVILQRGRWSKTDTVMRHVEQISRNLVSSINI